MDKVKKVSRLKKKKKKVDPTVIVNQKTQARQRKAATKHVNDLVSLLCKETCGKVEKDKPEDVFRLLFENVNSLGVFATGEARGRKLRQIRYLLKKWDVDMASFAETQVDWRHADEDHQFDNLFARGSDRRSVAACNSTVRKIPSPRNQRGGTAMMAFGRAVARVQEVDRDETKLGRFCWTKLGGPERPHV